MVDALSAIIDFVPTMKVGFVLDARILVGGSGSDIDNSFR